MIIGIALDWKDDPIAVIDEVNGALEKIGYSFVRMDDEMNDGAEYALVKAGETPPTHEEFYDEEGEE